MSPPESAELDGLRICVIGAGAAGLCALQVLKDTEQYRAGRWMLTAFEERDDVGGIWLPAPPTTDPPLTPLYDSLTTNLPHPIMAFRALSFPPGTPLFPRAAFVEEYLRAYMRAFGLAPHVRLRARVIAAHWTGTAWTVRVARAPKPEPEPGDEKARSEGADESTDEREAQEEEHEFDRLVVANGHYRVPRLPPVPGLDAWLRAGCASHSAWYRAPPAHWAGALIAVVGAGPSGQDITSDTANVARAVIHSVRGAVREDIGNVRTRGAIVRFGDVAAGTIVFEDGTFEDGVNHCVLATGYETALPFLQDVVRALPPFAPPLPARLHNSSYHIFPLARELFALQDTFPPGAAAFMGLPVRVVPFPLFEAQARVIAHVFAQPTAFVPALEGPTVLARCAALRTEFGDDGWALAHAWHRFRGDEQWAYRDALHAFAGLQGAEWRVMEWERELYACKGELRREWRALERAGEADEWVRDVGEGGIEEWVDLMRRLLHRADAT